MPNLLGISVEGEFAPSFDLTCLRSTAELPDGWGIGFYPGGEPSATVLKEPAPREGSIRGELVKAWQHLASSLFVVHIRRATWGGTTDANTQPFSRTHGGRDWIFAHAGSLRERLVVASSRRFTPVGATDTEGVFCELLSRIADRGWERLAEANLDALQRWLDELSVHGVLTVLLSDGVDLLAYADPRGAAQLHLWQFEPPHRSMGFGDADLHVDLGKRGVQSRKGVVLSTDPLEPDPGLALHWARVPPGTLLCLREGAVRAELAPREVAAEEPVAPLVFLRRPAPRPPEAPVRRLAVRHVTRWTYQTPVERSTHLFRLFPVHDRVQSVLSHRLSASVPGEFRDYDDVFGNRVRRLVLEAPYTELTVEATCQVEVRATQPLGQHTLHVRSTLPPAWMPWQRQMMTPYLLPPELPQSQLEELLSYAQSFARRNDHELVDTVQDINLTLHDEYRYQPGSTTLATTAFDVYDQRQGVCQDFANVFICLARLLGVPARYVCGYVFTGPRAVSAAGGAERAPPAAVGEASHAWVELYLPQLGWVGFDPTNGCLVQTDHVRLAVGRNYVDATPTAGTLWAGGEGERLHVEVRVERE